MSIIDQIEFAYQLDPNRNIYTISLIYNDKEAEFEFAKINDVEPEKIVAIESILEDYDFYSKYSAYDLENEFGYACEAALAAYQTYRGVALRVDDLFTIEEILALFRAVLNMDYYQG